MPRKRPVEIGARVGGHNHGPVEQFEALRRICGFGVGVPVSAIPRLAAPAEDSVGVIEDRHATTAKRAAAYLVAIPFRLADVFRDEQRQIDPHGVKSDSPGVSLRGTPPVYAAFGHG
jgi:hypothetical protein